MSSWGWKTNTGIAVMIAALLGDCAGLWDGRLVDQLFGLGQIVAFFGLRDAIRRK